MRGPSDITNRKMKSVIIFGVFLLALSTNAQARPQSDKLPHSLEAERAVLGAVVIEPEAILKVMPILKEDDFYLPEHRKIYRAMEALVSSGKPIDTVALMAWLESSGELESAGGIPYLSQLADGLPRVSNIVHHAQTVKTKATRRKLIIACDRISEMAQSESEDPGQVIERAVESILSLASRDSGGARIIEWAEAADNAYRELEKSKNEPGSVFRMESGLAKLDSLTSGLRKKELVLIVGATSHGKSLLAEQFAIKADEDGCSGIIFSAEMTAESIAIRQLAYEADVWFYRVRKPDNISIEQIASIRAVSQKNRRLAIVDRDITPARIFALAEARKRSVGLDFVIVDYDQLVVEAGLDPDSDSDDFFRHQSKFIRDSADFAKRIDVCMIVLAQQRKVPAGTKSGGKPQLDDIFGSSALRNHPHVIMWVVRDFFVKGLDKKYETKAHVYVLKSRNDATGAVEIFFHPKLVRFMDSRPFDYRDPEEF